MVSSEQIPIVPPCGSLQDHPTDTDASYAAAVAAEDAYDRVADLQVVLLTCCFCR